MPALLAAIGLRELVVNAWGYVLTADDAREDGMGIEGRVAGESDLEALAADIKADPARHHLLSEEEWTEWERVSTARRRWRESHLTYSYEAGLSVVVRGINGNGLP
jgi:hypothetical protein